VCKSGLAEPDAEQLSGSVGDADGPCAAVSRRPSIGVVDDDSALVQVYRRFLEAHGYAVDTAQDGQSALRLIRGKQFDVVLTDINMPGGGGIEILKTVHAQDRELPVVFMTGHPGFDNAHAAVEFGAVKYLVKPISAADLLKALADAICE